MAEHERIINNVVLVGLSGSGKSTVGRYLANRLNLPLYDTDAIIEAEAGRSAADIFASEGEAAFRLRESAVLSAVLAKSPAVIATGGGIVTVPENTARIRSSAFVVWLDATTSAILTRIAGHRQPRPLLQGDNPYERLEHMRQNVRRCTAGLPICTCSPMGSTLMQWPCALPCSCLLTSINQQVNCHE